MRSKNAQVSVRLNVRPLCANWKPVQSLEDNEKIGEKSPHFPELDNKVWKSKKFVESGASPKMTNNEVSTESSLTNSQQNKSGSNSKCGLIENCNCEKCVNVDNSPSIFEIQPLKNFRKKWSKLYSGSREKKEIVEKNEKSVDALSSTTSERQSQSYPPPPPPPSLTGQPPFDNQPPLIPPKVVEHVEPPDVQPAPVERQESLMKSMMRKMSESVSTKSSQSSCSSPKVSDSIENVKLLASEMRNTKMHKLTENNSETPENPNKVDSDSKIKLNQNGSSDYLIINHLPKIENMEEKTKFRVLEEIFYASESNMWLLIAIIVLIIIAYRSSIDPHMCYYD